MEIGALLGIGAVGLAVASAGAIGFYLLMPRRSTSINSSLMGRSSGARTGSQTVKETRTRLASENADEELSKIKQQTKRKAKAKVEPTLDELFFRAGIFSPQEKQTFFRIRAIAPVILAPAMFLAMLHAGQGMVMATVGAVIGGLFGTRIPTFLLDRRIKQRQEDILFYLPLVIEQIVIGVSSSLDVGPCIMKVISMADERDSHNSVTEMLALVQHHTRTGTSLEEALSRVGRQSGHTELKHTFMSLAQVARHGGEVTKQLQNLADAVSSQRESSVDEKIRKLELKATGPVAMVFFGFMIVLLIGFGIQIQRAFEP
jgi:Flp pilus assembly protein TadB